ncbi:Molydopterin dinucleotide binding domain-containing protein [Desulfuromusa kysingii]|uniref:Molydopterin dinucleotide binding domain-containing protein n=1 Tax=Desulfuromusa kysingii TaxID=37625 RepID=A0A1H4AUV8_9BACT|nr:molybdopterin dinucleotide binding domain-containing protein [Desulfuromusa kysingii]SEA39402.1 Molydopterin dinucleotide binding domain-containing protein [Desulfuromusa kysingii]
MLRPDLNNAEYVLFLGEYPGNSGKPMQAIGRQASIESNDGKLKFTVVDPVMVGGAVSSVGKSADWIPIIPTTDNSFVMAVAQWIIVNHRYNAPYMSSPTFEAAKKKGFNSYTNSSYLVITDSEHKNYRRLLRAEDLGLAAPKKKKGKAEAFIVIDKATQKPVQITATAEADLFFKGELKDSNGKPIQVETAFSLLKKSVMQQPLAEYARDCGIPVEKIIEIAKNLTSHGTKASIEGMGNTTSATGMNIAKAFTLINAMLGNINKKGGVINRRLAYPSTSGGPRYDLKSIKGGPKKGGVNLGRNGIYEKSTEYKNKVAAGQPAYPSRLPWHAKVTGADNQAVFSLINGYPYPAKILINWMSNPFFATPAAARKDVMDAFKNSDVIPLMISCDAFMGEMSAISDYIIPDTTQYESWGFPNMEGNFAGKYKGMRWPVVTPLTPKIDSKRHACFENYVIDVAKKIGIPGYGDKAITGSDKKTYPLNSPEDYFLRAAANTTYAGTPLPKLSAEEMQLQGLDEVIKPWKAALTEEEWPRVAFMMSRGGRYEPEGAGFDGDNHKYGYTGRVNIYAEEIATERNSITGKFYPGVITSEPERFADGRLLEDVFPKLQWPFKGVSYKAKLRSNSTLANSPILTSMSAGNYLEINPQDAAQQGFKDGDRVRIISATGATAEGILQVRSGVGTGVIAVAYGYGHWEYGVKKHHAGNRSFGGDAKRAKGVLLSGLSLVDPTFKEPFGYSDMATGSPARNGGAFRLEKI